MSRSSVKRTFDESNTSNQLQPQPAACRVQTPAIKKQKRQHGYDSGNDESMESKSPVEIHFPPKEINIDEHFIARKPKYPREGLYTGEQVRQMIQEALEHQQEKLREEYEEILSRLLREQWESFSTFNRHYISRTLNQPDRDSSYFS